MLWQFPETRTNERTAKTIKNRIAVNVVDRGRDVRLLIEQGNARLFCSGILNKTQCSWHT